MVNKHLIALLCSSVGAVSAALNSTCKCIPSNPCWPSAQSWSTLNDTLDGRVLPLSLPVTVCPNGEEASQTYNVNATDAKHVQAALQFANEYNLKVNVNNTGHAGDDTQRSATCGAMFIHTHYMKGLEFHEAYTPQSCPRNVSHMAATLGAGEQDDDVYQALAKYNAVTVGGTYDTVGIVGWATSGGHGWLTSSYGQGADNIYEVEIVTPAGEILIANECQNIDIFWATRGGGGGTYGVITKITMKAYPMPQTSLWMWDIKSNNETSASDWWQLVADLHALLVDINDKGFQGYYTIHGDTEGPWAFGGYFLAYDKSNATIQQTLAPFAAKLNATTDIATKDAWKIVSYDTWISAYNGLPKQGSTDSKAGPGGTVSVTRLVTREGLTADTAASAKMFQNISSSVEDQKMNLTGHIIAGSMIASSKHVDNALNPSWRDTTTHLIVKASWNEDLPSSEVQQIHDRFTNKIGQAMRSVSPDSGCYINECDQYEPDWQGAMYGPNYSRLRSIKAKYDPNNLLWCRKCVGSNECEYQQETGGLCQRSLTEQWPNYDLASALF